MIPFTTSRKFPGAALAVLLALSGAARLRAQVTVDDKADRIEALKQELEDAKRNRDRVVAKRWEDRRLDNEAREKFNQDYDDLKAQVEAKNVEADKLREEVLSVQKEAEEQEAQAENAKIQFSTLAGLLRERAKEIAAQVDRGFPVRVPERLQAANQVQKDAEARKDAPEEVLAEVLKLQLAELALTRDIALERKPFLMADKAAGDGVLLRLGTVSGAYRDDKTGRVGLLLKNDIGAMGANGRADNSFAAYDWQENLNPAAAERLRLGMEKLEQGGDAYVSLPVDVLANRGGAKAYVQQEKKTWKTAVRDYFRAGGVWLWPLVVIPFIALFIIGEKILLWSRRRTGNSALYEEVLERMRQSRAREAAELCERKPGSLILRAMRRIAAAAEKPRPLAEKDVQEVMLAEVPRLERHLTTLSVLAAAAPLLGLLGTVSGLINMFRTITLYGINDPKLLAGGISEALVCTETGLAVAIPIMLAHNFLANRIDNLVSDLQMYAAKTLNAAWPKG